MADNESSRNIRVSIPLDGMTWAHLRAFVNLGDQSGIPDTALVHTMLSEHTNQPIGLTLHATPGALGGVA